MKVVGATLGKRCSKRLSDSLGLASEVQSGVAASKRVQPTGLDLGCRCRRIPAGDLSEMVSCELEEKSNSTVTPHYI